jgi:putative ABC transport system permease protein
MNNIQQICAVVALNLRNLPQRFGSSLVIIIGSAGVVAVLVAVLAMAAGMSKTLQGTGRDDRAIILRNGSASESGSALTRNAARIVLDSSGIKHDADGTPESELMADADTVMSSDNGSTYGSVTVLLDAPGSLRTLRDSLTSNPALRVDVTRERDYFSRQSSTVSRLLWILVYVVGSIMGLGAIFGALTTMYSAVSTRTTEIATLRAIGFGSAPIVVSVLIEALLLAAAGGILGACAAWLFFNGRTVSTTQGSASAQLIFDSSVTLKLAVIGVAVSSVIGFIGGLFPAARALRLSIATALRAA